MTTNNQNDNSVGNPLFQQAPMPNGTAPNPTNSPTTADPQIPQVPVAPPAQISTESPASASSESPMQKEYVDTLRDEHAKLSDLPIPTENIVVNGGVKESLGPSLNQVTTPTPNVIDVLGNENPNLDTNKIIESDALFDEGKAYKAQLDDLLTLSVEKNASDLHLTPGYPPMLRIDGDLVNIGTQELAIGRAEKIFMSIITGRLKDELEKHSDVDFSYPHMSGNRFRVNVYKSKGFWSGAFRLIPNKIKGIAELGLPQVTYDLIKVPQGLILFTGPTGSGKSTSIAAMIQEINLTQNKHIITIEDPIEYVFPKAKSMVSQREIGQDTSSWTRALREILRQDPNVVLVGEMRDFETIAATITAAETGHLVFTTLHTNSASQTIDRIIDVFPEGQQNQIRSQLANVITAVISQRLIPLNRGGRKAVFEVLICTPAVKSAIRDGKTYQIDNMIQTNADLGMITLEKSLLFMVRNNEITIDQAMTFTSKPDELLALINKGK